MSWKKALLATIFVFICNVFAFAQITEMPPPPLPDAALLADILQASENLHKQGQAIEFKETVSFRLAAVLPEGRQTRNIPNRNVDYRQSADYAVRARSGQILEKTLIETHQPPRFGLNSLFKVIDIPTIQETLPPVASLKTGFLLFLSKEFVNGYKEVEREKVTGREAVKLALRFRPGRISIGDCFVWIDEKTHLPLKAELKIGDIDRYSNVVLKVLLEDVTSDNLPTRITQEVSCSTYENGIPIRLEHTSVYSELKHLPKEQ
jgi:hypothetical protein